MYSSRANPVSSRSWFDGWNEIKILGWDPSILQMTCETLRKQLLHKIVLTELQEVEKEVEIYISKLEWNLF